MVDLDQLKLKLKIVKANHLAMHDKLVYWLITTSHTSMHVIIFRALDS